MKKVQWKLTRALAENPQAQSRWDQAFQLLLAHPGPVQPAPQAQTVKITIASEEVKVNEGCRLCQGLKPAAGPDPVHRSTVGAP